MMIDIMNSLKLEINNFKEHGKIDLFMGNAWKIIETVLTASIHAFSLYHKHLKDGKEIEISTSKFVNERTFRLMNYFSECFENQVLLLAEGIPLIVEYLQNFGILFEDRPEGGYIYVVDIE